MPEPRNYIQKRAQSFGYALNGIRLLFVKEPNARIHLLALTAVIFLGFYLRVSSHEWIVLILCIGAVLAAEALNSSIEKLADYVQPEKHLSIKHTKDIAAGGVLIASLASLVIGLIIFIPKLQLLW